MKRILTPMIFLSILIFAIGCTQQDQKENSSPSEKVMVNGGAKEGDAGENEMTFVYATLDSSIRLGNEVYAVHVDQVDYSNQAYLEKDTLPRPTYGCHFTVRDQNSNIVCKDSVFRDSWGYPGKISSIDAYQIGLPEIVKEDNEIHLRFKVYDYSTLDAILGVYAIEPLTKEIRLFWEESSLDE